MTERTRKIGSWLLLIAGFLFFLHLIKPILLPFVVGIGIAYFLDPAADRLEKEGMSRAYATCIIILAFFSVIVLGFVLVMPVLSDQVVGFVKELPAYIDHVKQMVQPFMRDIFHRFGLDTPPADATLSASSSLIGMLSTVGASVISSGAALFNILALLMITPLVAFYLLRDWDRIVERVDALLPRRHAAVIEEQCRAIDKTLAGFLRGQLNVCLALAFIYAVGLSIVGLKYSLLIALMGGILIIVPYLGAGLTGIVSLAVGYVQFGEWDKMLQVACVLVIAQIAEGYVLTPKLVGENVGLHPLWILFGMLSGGAIFGFVGVLLAVPVTAVIGVLVRFAVARYLESDLYHS